MNTQTIICASRATYKSTASLFVKHPRTRSSPTMASPLPDLPSIDITFPSTPLILAALAYTKQHTSFEISNHCVRSAYWALIIAGKHDDFVSAPVDMRLTVFAILMHDLGWAATKELLSKDKRFEVDGADLARSFLKDYPEEKWDQQRVQLAWDAIALHTTPSIALHKEREVCLTHMGIAADFFGGNTPGGLITAEEYRTVEKLFPRTGFKEELVRTLCGLCRDKAETTFDNLAGEAGREYGYDGKG